MTLPPARREIVFWTKGDGGDYRVMLFTVSNGQQPAVRAFRAPAEWTEIRIPFASFNVTDAYDVQAIVFSGGPKQGAFRVLVDEVRLRD